MFQCSNNTFRNNIGFFLENLIHFDHKLAYFGWRHDMTSSPRKICVGKRKPHILPKKKWTTALVFVSPAILLTHVTCNISPENADNPVQNDMLQSKKKEKSYSFLTVYRKITITPLPPITMLSFTYNKPNGLTLALLSHHVQHCLGGGRGAWSHISCFWKV